MFESTHHQHAGGHGGGFRQKRFHWMRANHRKRLGSNIMALQETGCRAGKCGRLCLILSDTQNRCATSTKPEQREKLHGTHRTW